MKYRTSVDVANMNNSQSAILRRIQHCVPPGGSILDVGCASGDLASALTQHGYRVWGIEMDPDAYELASGTLSGGAVGDLNVSSLDALVEGPFDAIVFGDVLEHLLTPERHVRDALSMLTPGGRLIASIPNVAHGSVRLALLEGRWRYTPEGLLDETHVRFFTYESVVALFQENGFRITSLESTVLDVLATEVDVDDKALPDDIVEWVRDQEHASAFQFIVEAEVGEPTEDAPACLPLVDYNRPHDVHAARRRIGDVPTARAARQAAILESFQQERLALLSLRDYAMGSEAAAARYRHETESLRTTNAQLREEVIETHARLASTVEEVIETHARLASTVEDVLQTHERLARALAENASLRQQPGVTRRLRSLAGRVRRRLRHEG